MVVCPLLLHLSNYPNIQLSIYLHINIAFMHKYQILSNSSYETLVSRINDFAKNNTIINTQYSTCCNHNTIIYSILITYLPKT